jgi:predicted metal-dependent hydrolase
MMWPTLSTMTSSARIKRRLDGWAVKLRVMPRLVRVQRMTQKWGSCSTAGTITLASDLDDESAQFQDFVIVHELLHMKVRNHGRLFKALMTAHIPDWRMQDVRRKRASLKASTKVSVGNPNEAGNYQPASFVSPKELPLPREPAKHGK